MSAPRMPVTIRDRAAEAPWGVGLTNPAIRTVDISASCPRCGGERGTPTKIRQHDDGATYYVDTWENPCGHVDLYADVAKEAAALAAGSAPIYPAPGSKIPGMPGYVVGECEHRVAGSEWRAGFRTCERCPRQDHKSGGQRP